MPLTPPPPVTVVSRVDAGQTRGSDLVADSIPALTWRTTTTLDGWRQARAWLRVRRGDGSVDGVEISGRRSVRVPWPFAPLSPRERVQVQVRVQGEAGDLSDWSVERTIVAGFLGEGEWCADSIALADPAERARPAELWTTFTLDRPVRSAVLYATAHGVYQVAVNGIDVDDQVLKPGWTPADRRVHETTDVTHLLEHGTNALTVRLAGGWGTEVFGWPEGSPPDDQPSVALQLRIEHDDGTLHTVCSDGSWRGRPGSIISSGLYAGESYDARIAPVDPARPDDTASEPVRVVDPLPVPTPRTSPAVRRIETLPVQTVSTREDGRLVLDFGQNLVGWLRLRVRGPRGTVITLRHAEVLEDAELCLRPLRSAAATDRYVLRGGEQEEWEPEFTFHGFRYAEIKGWPGPFDPADVEAVVVHSDLARTGWFSSSHALLDRFHENVVWSLRGNFLALPTDCPQRDERLGWTGDIQVFAPAAGFLFDVRGFLASWLDDLLIDQRAAGGVVPWVVPNVFHPTVPAAAWGDAVTIVPTAVHERYDDRETLRRALPGMRAWADAITALTTDGLWTGGFQFGDWLDPDAPPSKPEAAKTHPDIVASAYRIRSLDLLAAAEREVGDERLAEEYAARARDARDAFTDAYIGTDGVMTSDAPTAYALALRFELVDAHLRPLLGARLATLVRDAEHRIGTGFVGTPLLLDALTDTGHLDDATQLMLQQACPSWLYPVTMGATTIWERWDSLLPDGSVNPGQMTSFNHYALGAVADWLHRVAAGLSIAAPGGSELLLAPRPLAGLDHASAVHDTPYGRAECGWRRRPGGIAVRAVVPANTTADVALPDGRRLRVGSGIHDWVCAWELATL